MLKYLIDDVNEYSNTNQIALTNNGILIYGIRFSTICSNLSGRLLHITISQCYISIIIMYTFLNIFLGFLKEV